MVLFNSFLPKKNVLVFLNSHEHTGDVLADVITSSEYEVAGPSTNNLGAVYSLPANSDTVQRTSFASHYQTH